MEWTEFFFGITYCIDNEIYAVSVHLNSVLYQNWTISMKGSIKTAKV